MPDEGIKIIWRPPGEPHFGGHIERLIGTQMGPVHLLPGSTSSNVQDRREYDSKRHAALTLRELERYIALEITGQYHQVIHGTLRRPPIAVWQEHEAEAALRLPQDRMRFWISFLPEEERMLRPDGIHLFKIRYWSPALTADVGRSKGRLLVKYDPRDLSRVFVRRPSGNFVDARYADVGADRRCAGPTILTPKSLRRILQVTDGITGIFHMINGFAAEAAERGLEQITDKAVENWHPLVDVEAAYA